jgi:long-chain acyl-CoA synthetase
MLRLIAEVGAKVVIAPSERIGLFANAGVLVRTFQGALAQQADLLPAGRCDGPVLLLYTSGSTEERKRLCCTQSNLYFEASNFVETVGLNAADNILCTIPLHHSYGLGNCLLDAFYAGSTLVLLEPDEAPFAARCGRVMELIRDEAIHFYPGVPYQFQTLAALPEDPRPDLSALKLCVSSGDLLPRRTYERFRERFGLPIRSLYGSTEAGSIALDMDVSAAREPGCFAPLRNVEFQIRDGAGRNLPPNECGRIWVKSPVIPPSGYENRPELTAQVFRDGFYDTGDLGLKDGRGNLVLFGRKKSFVDVGGHKVAISEVEEVLEGQPDLREAAVLPVQAPHLGTLLKAVVVPRGPCTESDILAFCRARLPAFKVPRLIEFRESLPRSPIGKVLKSELAALGSFLDPVSAIPCDQQDMAEQIQELAALCLQREPALISRSAPFRDLGFDSLRVAELHQRLVKLTGFSQSITVLWNYPTIDELAGALWAVMQAPGSGSARESRREASFPVSFNGSLGKVEQMSDAEVDGSSRSG